MNPTVHSFLLFLERNKAVNNKDLLIEKCVAEFDLVQDRKVFHNDYFSVRFSFSRTGSFSNTVLSLSMLEKYDQIPFFAVLVKGNADNVVYLANTTFINKISHSSQNLSMTNIRGSFNGSDIIKEFSGIENKPDYFDKLFAIHKGLEWQDNLLRLVEASSRIRPVSTKFVPNDVQLACIYQSVDRARQFVDSENYETMSSDLNKRCNEVKEAIMAASHIDNVNIRGRLIEALITSDKEDRLRLLSDMANLEQALPTYDTQNGLGDYIRFFDDSDTYTDVKTKVLYLDSNPKMYNIDKFLQCMAEEKSVFLFFFIGINENGIQKKVLCSVYHPTLIKGVHLQSHWAGRSTRGVVQASGDSINLILDTGNGKCIDIDLAKAYIDRLIHR